MPFNLVVVLILLGGWLFGRMFSRLGLPSVLGMVIWGICIGTFLRPALPQVLFQLEPFLKSFALVVILLRAGLSINKSSLQKAGLTAGLMAAVPCIAEGFSLMVLFHLLFGFDWAVAGLTGFMLAAVSPAVIVPSMLKLKEKGYGSNSEVPTIIVAGASADDVLAIAFFAVFLQMGISGSADLVRLLWSVPLSLAAGIVPGIMIGSLLVWYFRKRFVSIRATEKVLILLMVSLVSVEIGDWIHSAALLGLMTIGFVILENEEKIAHELSLKLSKIWIFAEIILFVLIGISVNVSVAWSAGLLGLAVISAGLLFRSAGVFIATLWSGLSLKEKLFCMIANIPKATVQAALGGVALSAGLAKGDVVLAIAVLSIVFTAPLGLIGIKYSAEKLLKTQISES